MSHHWKSISLLKRSPGQRRLDADLDAYRRLRHDGLQPPQIDGCADLERKGTDRLDIEMGRFIKTDGDRAKVREGLERAADLRLGL